MKTVGEFLDIYDAYVGLDGHWYVRAFGYLIYRSEWRADANVAALGN